MRAPRKRRARSPTASATSYRRARRCGSRRTPKGSRARRSSISSRGSRRLGRNAGCGRPLLYLGLFGRLLADAPRSRRRRHVVHELEVRHLRRVAPARAELDDPRVAAGTLLETRRDVGEQHRHDVVRAQERKGVAPRGEVAAAAQGDHLLRNRADGLRLGDGRLDPAVLDHGTREVRVESLTVRRIAAELLALAMVPHEPYSSPRSVRPCVASVSLTSSIDFLPKFGIAASSFSLLTTRSPIVSMPTRLRQLYERTPSSSSSIGKFSIPCASETSGPAASAAAPASRRPSIRSRSVKSASWRIRISAASPIASRGVIEPSVVTSSVSLS